MANRRGARLTVEQMMFVQAWLADPARNQTNAYDSVFESKSRIEATERASKLLRHPKIKAYIALLEESAAGNVTPEKHVHVEVEGNGQLTIKPHGKLLEAAEITQRELENLIALHLVTGPTDVLDEDGEVKPEYSHLVDSYEVKITYDKEGNMERTVKVRMPSREGLMKMFWTCKGCSPTKTVSDEPTWAKAILGLSGGPEAHP